MPTLEDFGDRVSPQQFNDMRRRALSPVHKLLLSVLNQAISEATGLKAATGRPRCRTRRLTPATIARIARHASKRRENAIDWIFDDAATGVFSFENICGELGIEARSLRARVRRAARVPNQNPAPPPKDSLSHGGLTWQTESFNSTLLLG